MSALTDAVTKLQADVTALENATLANLSGALAAIKTDAQAVASLVNAVVVAVTDIGIAGLTDDQKPMVPS